VVSRGRALTLALLAAAAWTALECSPATSSTTDGGADAAACPQDLPASCPARVPSYQTDVEGIIASKCNGCHTDGGVGSSKFDFSTYASVYADRSSMLNQIYACRMPPPDAGALTPDERALLLAWFVCHAPNN